MTAAARGKPRPAALAAAALVALVVFAAWPGLQADWGRDDFFQLAFVRLLQSPLALFAHDHYPVPGSVYRPLGFLSMWLGERAFGTAYPRHALSDLALHAAVALALFGLLRRCALSVAPSLAAALLFALHPLAIGTSLWWSARFDLLATLFVLLALHAALAHGQRPRVATLALTLLAALAAMLSKEIGLVALPAIGLAWLAQATREPGRRAALLRAFALLALVAAGFLGWRAHVLGTAASGLTGSLPLAEALPRGIAAWLRQMPAYVAYRPGTGLAGTLAAGALLLAACVALWREWRMPDHGRAGLLAAGLCLFLLPALLQAPVAALNAAPLQAQASAVEAAMQSRLYYLGMAGIALVAAVLLQRLASAGRVARLAVAVVAGVVLATQLLASRELAREFAQVSRRNAQAAHAAAYAVDRLALPARGCHVALLGLPRPAEWGDYVSADSIVKALAADPRHVARCWIHGDGPTWFHLLRAPVAPADALPWQALAVQDVALPWLEVGGVAYAYLRPIDDAGAAIASGLRVLAYRDGRFEDVTSAVAGGSVPIELR